MAMRTATLRLQLLESVSGPSRTAANALRRLEQDIAKLGGKGMPGAKNLVGQLNHLQQKSAAIGKFTELRRGLASTFGEFRTARTRVQELQRALDSATRPTAKMRADLRSSQSALRQATNAYNEQRAAVRSAAEALRSFSTNSRTAADSQRNVRQQIAQTIRSMRNMREEAKKSQPPQTRPQSRPQQQSGGGSPYVGAAAGAVGAYGAYQGGRIFTKAFGDTVAYDQVRSFRDALAGDAFSDSDRERLNEQAKKIGYETRFTNADAIVAQLGVLQGGIRDAELILNAVEPIKDYALAMGVTLEEATETVRASSQILQIPLGDADAIREHVNSLVWMAKNAGMSNDDVRQYIRYGGSSMRSLNISEEMAAAMGIVLRRAGTPGDEAGVFARTAAAKIGAPTNPGRMALQTMGLNYDDYVTWPEAFKVEGLSKMVREQFGTHIPQGVQDEITRFIAEDTFYHPGYGEDMPVGTDRGAFVDGIMQRLESTMGKLSKLEQNKLAKLLGDFHKFSAESVDTERLLLDIFKSNPSPAQLNAFFTQRQGNRANIIASRFEDLLDAIELMRNPPDDIARQIGEDAHSGLFGDWTRAVGAVETALITAVEDWSTPIQATLKGVDYLASEFTHLSESSRRLIEVFGVLALAAGGYAAMKAGKGLLGKLFGGKTRGDVLIDAIAEEMGLDIGDSDGRKKKGPKTRKGPGLFGWLGRATALAAPLLLSGSAGSNAYLDASAEEREKARDKARREAEAYNAANPDSQWGPWFRRMLLGAAADPNFDAKAHFGIAVTPRARAKNQAQGDLASATADWPMAAQQALQGYVQALAVGGAEAEAEAAAIGQAIEQELSVTGNPDVNTAKLERALSIARQLAAVMRSELGGGASTNVDGSPVVGGSRSSGGAVEAGKTYAIGKRPEFFTPSRDGMVTTQHPSGGMIHAPVTVSITVNGSADTSTIRQLEAAAERAVRRAMSGLDNKLNRGNRMPFTDLQFGDM